MTQRLAGKTAFITAAGQGIGSRSDYRRQSDQHFVKAHDASKETTGHRSVQPRFECNPAQPQPEARQKASRV